MSTRVLRSASLAVAALAVGLVSSSAARAFACETTPQQITTSTTSLTDCAGNTVDVSFNHDSNFGEGTIVLSGSGPWSHDDWFSDLHISIELSESADLSWSTGANSFFSNDAGDAWAESFMEFPTPFTAWFVANDGSERVFSGDDYRWQAHLAYFSASISRAPTASVGIDYTMDVPEPALGVLFLGGIAALALTRRRGA